MDTIGSNVCFGCGYYYTELSVIHEAQCEGFKNLMKLAKKYFAEGYEYEPSFKMSLIKEVHMLRRKPKGRRGGYR